MKVYNPSALERVQNAIKILRYGLAGYDGKPVNVSNKTKGKR